jgi:hypothetical protein
LSAFLDTRALPSAVVGPVDFVQGRQLRICAACRARRSCARGVYGVAGNGRRVGTTAALSAPVNFEAREIGFATSNTITSGQRSMPELDISSTLRYSAGVNNFSAAVQNQGGDMSGQAQGRFYGPAAQEIGGVYSLSSAGRIQILTGARSNDEDGITTAWRLQQ